MTRDHRLQEGPRATRGHRRVLRRHAVTVLGGAGAVVPYLSLPVPRKGKRNTRASGQDLSHFREHAASESSNARFGCYTNTTHATHSDCDILSPDPVTLTEGVHITHMYLNHAHVISIFPFKSDRPVLPALAAARGVCVSWSCPRSSRSPLHSPWTRSASGPR